MKKICLFVALVLITVQAAVAQYATNIPVMLRYMADTEFLLSPSNNTYWRVPLTALKSNMVSRAELAGSNYTTSAQIAGSNYLTALTAGTQVAGSNYLTAATAGAQIGGSNYLTAATAGAQVGGSNYLTAATAGAQVGGSNYLTATTAGTQVGGSNYTTRAQIASSNYVQAAISTNYFVLTTGSDANVGTGNAAGTAFRTIQKAINVVSSYFLSNGATPTTIQIGDGVYNENITLLPLIGNGQVIINGNSSTPANVLLAPSTGDAVTVAGPVSGCTLQNFKIWATNGNSIAASLGGSVVVGTGMNFGPAKAGGYHLLANNNSAILVGGNYTIMGGTGNHYYSTRGSVINSTVSPTVTITGTPAFTAFAACDDAGVVAIFGATFSGSTTGKRFDINLNGVMHTLSGSATYFPGNAAGTTNNGAQYQ